MRINKKNPILVATFAILILTIGVPVNGEIDAPKKQMKRGIAIEDITCRQGLELVIRTNESPACVKPDTAKRMQELGIAFVPTTFTKTEKEIETVPASSRSIVNFYITDQDLNLAHNAVEVVQAKELFEFTINGIPIEGPEKIIETGPNTGQFYVRLNLPETIDGKQLDQDDIILIKYLDESDFSGEQRVIVKSVQLTKTFAKVQTEGSGGSRIGHEFTIRLYEPDANRDSKDEDKIPLSSLEFRGEGGIRTTLANPKFDANRPFLVETGPNTSTFEVEIKIPRQIDGKVVNIGDRYEIRYIDRSTPSNTNEKVIFNGRIG